MKFPYRGARSLSVWVKFLLPEVRLISILNILDARNFFGVILNLEPYYIMMKKFLDIPSRVMALNQKLDVLQELLDILNSSSAASIFQSAWKVLLLF